MLDASESSDVQTSSPQASSPSNNVVQSSYWHWEGYGKVHYRHAGTTGPVIVFIPGFGVGAFHFDRNLRTLSASGFRVFAVDKLGMGDSAVPSAAIASLVSPSLWRSQLIAFIEHVLPHERVFLAGNSLGGLLAASVASVRPDLLRGLLLLNAAPFWTHLPAGTPNLVRACARAVLRLFWRRLTNASIIRQTLSLVYARADAVSDSLVAGILAPTRAQWAEDAFQSSLIAPKLEPSFEEAVSIAAGTHRLPVAAVNGRSDPWVGPVWGARLKKVVPECALYELEPCGHCAHDEAAAAVEFVVKEWVDAVVEGRSPPTLGSEGAPAGVGGVQVMTRDEPRRAMERLAGAGNVAFTFVLATIDSVL